MTLYDLKQTHMNTHPIHPIQTAPCQVAGVDPDYFSTKEYFDTLKHTSLFPWKKKTNNTTSMAWIIYESSIAKEQQEQKQRITCNCTCSLSRPKLYQSTPWLVTWGGEDVRIALVETTGEALNDSLPLLRLTDQHDHFQESPGRREETEGDRTCGSGFSLSMTSHRLL